jgi:D-ribose pyranose/furanose isomerase RbsD
MKPKLFCPDYCPVIDQDFEGNMSMNPCHKRAVCISCLMVLLPLRVAAAQSSKDPCIQDWYQTFENRLAVFGHRNWIVVADSAYPAPSGEGVETIVANGGLPEILARVLAAMAASKHVRPVVFMDKELQFVDEKDYPGVTAFRKQIGHLAAGNAVNCLPHEEIMTRLNDAAKTYRVLIIKTDMKIPYTSVFMRLDCGYMSDEVGHKIDRAMSAPAKSAEH